MAIPQEPVILLSFVNTKLRDYYKTLEDLCKSLEINQVELTSKLSQIEYYYSQEKNQFI